LLTFGFVFFISAFFDKVRKTLKSFSAYKTCEQNSAGIRIHP